VYQTDNWYSRIRTAHGRLFSAGESRLCFGQIFFLFFLILYTASNAPAQEKKHSDPSRSCVSSECHTPIAKHKYLHGPLKIGQCTVCHAPLPGGDHKFKLVETEEKLCLICHRSVATKGFKLHDPVAKGKCLVCHDPHGSEEPYHARKSPAAKMCEECHKSLLTRDFAHKPVATGECLSCHRPHGAMDKNLLDVTGPQLCLKCHEKRRPYQTAGKGQKVHLGSEDCSRCHRPHDSSQHSRLAKPAIALCLDGCHKEVKEDSNKFKHWDPKKPADCVDCHRAHDSTFGRLLRQPVPELCFTCHDELQSQIAAAKFKHRPTSDNRCLSCHLPHSSKFGKLLPADYPSATLSSFDPAKYALCFNCHEDGIVRERYVDNRTKFRNGRLNLHFLHVNREKDAHTCRACHDAHASNQPAQIREKVSSGNWAIPIKFTKSKTGGSCLTGCHKEYTYDRANPVQLNAK
jgi:predicted CXXCH cytochrome family protein